MFLSLALGDVQARLLKIGHFDQQIFPSQNYEYVSDVDLIDGGVQEGWIVLSGCTFSLGSDRAGVVGSGWGLCLGAGRGVRAVECYPGVAPHPGSGVL